MPARTPAKIDVGGVEVTPEEIRSAIDVLTSSTWVMVDRTSSRPPPIRSPSRTTWNLPASSGSTVTAP